MSKRLIYAEDAIEEIIRRLGIKDESYLTAQEKAVVQVLKDMPPTQPQDIARDIANIIENEKDMRVMLQQRWIPVSERLPERGKDVLVTRNYDGRADHIKSCRYVEVASCYGEDDDVSWNSYSDEYKMTPKNHRVVAWMPLPEPWRGEKDETN